MQELFPPDSPLLSFSKSRFDSWTIRDAYEGVQIFGELGSGKTSGSGKALATAFLGAGFGGLVLTAKADERKLWEELAAATGRSDDLHIFSPERGQGFNFLNYELKRPGKGAGDTDNLIKLFRYILDIAEQKTSSKEAPFWDNSLNQLLRNSIDIATAAHSSLQLREINEIIKSAPYYPEQLESPDWKEESFCIYSIEKALANETLSPQKKRDVEFAADYWLKEFPFQNAKTRATVVSMFTGLADNFLRGKMFDLFCHKITVLPEMSATGKIIILDIPVKEYGESGRLAQVLFKYLWQQAVERRNVNQSPRPVFLWADEAQNFCASYDLHFQATARSSRACTVYLTQNLPLYYASFGSGDKGKQEAEALLGNLATKIFHANGDRETNNFAADTIGKSWQTRTNTNSSFSNNNNQNQSNTSAGTSESYDYDVVPQEFNNLRKGGTPNGLIVEGILFKSGKQWTSTGKSYTPVKFRQD